MFEISPRAEADFKDGQCHLFMGQHARSLLVDFSFSAASKLAN
jgi:hypothetical protein